MSVRTTPQDGDIVIRQENRERSVVYVLHTAPGPDQYVLRSRDESVAQAVTLAKREHVRAWLTDEGYDFVLLEDFRVVESVSFLEGFVMAQSAKRASDQRATALDRS